MSYSPYYIGQFGYSASLTFPKQTAISYEQTYMNRFSDRLRAKSCLFSSLHQMQIYLFKF